MNYPRTFELLAKIDGRIALTNFPEGWRVSVPFLNDGKGKSFVSYPDFGDESLPSTDDWNEILEEAGIRCESEFDGRKNNFKARYHLLGTDGEWLWDYVLVNAERINRFPTAKLAHEAAVEKAVEEKAKEMGLI